MGLDVYKWQAIKDITEIDLDKQAYISLDEDQVENISTLKLFEKFKDSVHKKVIKVINYDHNLNINGYIATEWRCVSERVDEEGFSISFVNNNDSEQKMTLVEEQLVETDCTLKVIYVKEINYQRKGFKDQTFFDNFYGKCWYVSNNSEKPEDETVRFVLTNELLNEAKKYFNTDSQIQDWSIGEDEFVEFNA